MTSYCLTDTIYALSSGAGKGGVAVIRVSGSNVREICLQMVGLDNPKPRYAYFKPLKGIDGHIIDHALILFFEGPHSFTGEDVVEFQVHGGTGVVSAVFEALSSFTQTRPAERGEFSRRAVVYGKMDLTEAEGLMDLIDAQTEQQRKQALTQMEGKLGSLYENWRKMLIRNMAYLEAFIDFPEEDIPPEKLSLIDEQTKNLIHEIEQHLDDKSKGQRLRNGFQIALVGVPNVGKSSLMNALTNKDIAIVSCIAGTTRDVVEAHLDVAGFPVILADTAGLREQVGEIESEGIRRAVRKAEESDLILYVQDLAHYPHVNHLPTALKHIPTYTIWNKCDMYSDIQVSDGFLISAKTGFGISQLWEKITDYLKSEFSPDDTGTITRERYRTALNMCLDNLQHALNAVELELKAEDLRLAARSLGRITGRIETDELLDVIFRDFCIGK
ncbi:MAG: tRNA uridine-5-carboxymethylaminomethyl(34) synthesis GTPase MnmE [Alphaproteobacteria bacterium]|nr:tRNA uridine-5-carboxymethylaminomethyl(34) synthesis GTPase MnmE [Alphaproteobacteria bacterium]